MARPPSPGLSTTLDARIASLVKDLPPRSERLGELIARRRSGFRGAEPSAARGADLFVKHCAVCHQLDGKGAKLGPQLDGIGRRGLDRLLEDLIDPSRNVDPGFRSTLLVLRSGRIVRGLATREEGQALIVVDAQGTEQHVPLTEIEERHETKSSAMPENILEVMDGREFYDLVTYLLAQRQELSTK